MKKTLQKALALLMVFCMSMGMLCTAVSAAEEKTPYWRFTGEVNGVTQTITHAVLDSNGNLVNIGTEPGELDADDLEPGTMAARKFGAFEDEEDAANGIVKLTFDVVGKPVEVPGPLDVVIIADESGSLNMYGRGEQGTRADNQNIRGSASYMPCLNEEHAYLVGDLQKELYQIALVRLDAAIAVGEEVTDDAESIRKMLEEDAISYDVYINPHDADLEYTVFGSWGSVGNESAVREMIEVGKLVDGTSANVDIPEILTNDDVYLALLSDWDEVAMNSKGNLTFTTNYSTIQTDAETGGTTETVTTKTATREGWDPDTSHCYFEDGAYVLIEQPMNENTVSETGELYSYWSPATDNAYGCYDRMIIEKEGVVSLANQILNADPDNNRVAYVGFTRGAYPSLSSYSLGDNGFCGLNDADLNEMLAIMANTNGHDYTNYIHPLYMARKIISMREDQDRPCYVVFISDGVPTTSGGFSKTAHVSEGGWNVLSLANGDYPWYDDVYNNSNTHVEAAGKMAEYFKTFLKETAGEDTGFYTVGFSTNETASALLADMASDAESFFNCATVEQFLSKMQIVRQGIMTHYPSGVLTDVIGEDFDLLVDEDHPFVVDGAEFESMEAAAAAGCVSIDEDSLAWNLQSVDEEGVQISFYVKLTNEELNKFENNTTRVYDTNKDTQKATGANLEYHALIVDDAKSEGYYAEENATNIAMETPQVEICNDSLVPDAAVTLTIDMSGTMYRYKMDGKRYVEVAKAKALDFVNQYAASATSEDDLRMLAISCFDTDAKVVLNWVDVNTAEGLAAAKTAINGMKVVDNGKASSNYVCTNFDGGIILTRNMMKQDAVKDIEKKFAIILSDGAPTVTVNSDTDTVGTIKSSFWGNQLRADGTKYQNARCGGGWTHPAEVDRTLSYLGTGSNNLADLTVNYRTEDGSTKEGIFIVGVGGDMSVKLFNDAVYGTSNGTRTSDVKRKPAAFNNVDALAGYTQAEILKMTTGGWLENLAELVGGTYESAANSAALQTEFDKIIEVIKDITNP